MRKKIMIANVLFLSAVFTISMTGKHSLTDDWAVPEKYTKMKNPYAEAKDSEQIGKRLYAVHCKSCHGTKGLGDGSKAAELKTKMPDFTATEFKSQTDGVLYYKTYIGKDEMPAFDKKISEAEDQWLLVNYIKSL
ncbi:MAG: cytochrome c [Cyclobacteriaceae bacterium]|nr:cytochrome c [Cyclobacteriaceae bacterium]